MIRLFSASLFLALSSLLTQCQEGPKTKEPADGDEEPEFYFGADLSYVNQILDHGGVYKDEGEVRSPYQIFADHGTNLARFRLWHNPEWTKELYGAGGTQRYNDLKDAEKGIEQAREQGMAILLDFHFSDSWADPGKQEIPAAWKDIKNITLLGDSVFQYTLKTLQYLNSKGLMPELVQIGNETNCGMLYTDAPSGFPTCNVCNDQWSSIAVVINKAILAVKTVADVSDVKTRIALHVADPVNIDWWFDNIKSQAGVTGFDIIGISYYPLWHTGVMVTNLGQTIKNFRSKFGKDVMILETAYPWTSENADGYNNIFGETPITGYTYSKDGQLDMVHDITQQVMDAGGIGVVYWEPGWITSNMKDKWGTGSSWENCAFFDFDSNPVPAMNWPGGDYDK